MYRLSIVDHEAPGFEQSYKPMARHIASGTDIICECNGTSKAVRECLESTIHTHNLLAPNHLQAVQACQQKALEKLHNKTENAPAVGPISGIKG